MINPKLKVMGVHSRNSFQLRKNLLENIHPEHHFNCLFDVLPEVSFFAKDKDGVLLLANKHLLNLYGYESEEKFIGLTDFDLLPLPLAEKYRADDIRVMESKESLLNVVELFLNHQGIPEWSVTNKFPLLSTKGEVLGVMGTIQNYKDINQTRQSYSDIGVAVDYIKTNYTQKVTVKKLAEMSNLSIRQFERKFKFYFNATPQQFLIKLRVQAACELLKNHKATLSDIAVDLAFYDQSSFTTHFKKCMGITPLQYRNQY